MNILHAHTDPTLLQRLKGMLARSHRADIAVGYLFVSGFNAVAEELGQLLAAMECAPATRPLPLPGDTNERVMAAYEVARRDAATRIGCARRPSTDTRLRRYLARQLRLAREAAGDDGEELKRIGVLQQIFLEHLPSAVLAELAEVRRMELGGHALVRRLEALRERHRLNPPEPSGTALAATEVMRIVCSDGLV